MAETGKYIHIKGIERQNIHAFEHLTRGQFRDLEAGKTVELSQEAVAEVRALNVWIRKISKKKRSK